jgi:hypothetical protein
VEFSLGKEESQMIVSESKNKHMKLEDRIALSYNIRLLM